MESGSRDDVYNSTVGHAQYIYTWIARAAVDVCVLDTWRYMEDGSRDGIDSYILSEVQVPEGRRHVRGLVVPRE